MIAPLSRFYHWLHGMWPAGKPEKLPAVQEDGSTNVPGVYVVGDLSGIPLLKFSLETGVQAVRKLHGSPEPKPEGGHDLVIIGGGVAGVAAMVEAKKLGMDAVLLESSRLFSTIANFPKGKPIYTYPMEMEPAGDLQVSAEIKESLLDELTEQVERFGVEATPGMATHVRREQGGITVHLQEGEALRARGVVVAIGRSGNYRSLGVAGEELDKVSNRLHDPAKYTGKKVLVVGGGDSAMEAAIAIAELNPIADQPLVTVSYRKAELSRPKPENVARIMELAQEKRIDLRLGSQLGPITESEVVIKQKGQADATIGNDYVFSLIGREAPLDFFRRSGITIRGEFSIGYKAFLIAFFAFITLAYGMKGWIFPFDKLNGIFGGLAGLAGDKTNLLGTIMHSSASPGFWVTLLYSSAVVVFGVDRMRRRKTPYVRVQTATLMTIQVLPLFILPEIILPWMGANDWVPTAIRENLFPGDSWWRAYGFVLAWPLMAWNIFTQEPIMWWLIIGVVQTFVIIPLIVWRWGKGAYCGWVCSCGALAETMGDRHREKMPHGPAWNKVNMVGQIVLWTAFIIFGLHIVMWLTTNPGERWGWLESVLMKGYWKHAVDFLLAGALGTGLYFWLSGRVWCRFACPLAALMHIYAKFTQFRITVDQKKCISCNACTTVCHQGIDIMNFANKGKHMADVECVRCSACVQTCPTGVLQFGRVDGQEKVVALDTLVASPVVAREGADDRLGKDGSGN